MFGPNTNWARTHRLWALSQGSVGGPLSRQEQRLSYWRVKISIYARVNSRSLGGLTQNLLMCACELGVSGWFRLISFGNSRFSLPYGIQDSRVLWQRSDEWNGFAYSATAICNSGIPATEHHEVDGWQADTFYRHNALRPSTGAILTLLLWFAKYRYLGKCW